MTLTLNSLSTALSGALDMKRVRRRAEAVAACDVNYGESAFAKSAALCEGFLRESGFSRVKTIELPCDGKTAHLDCVMPQAWDRTGRSFFEIVSPAVASADVLVCDTDETPFAIGMWSAPTPAEGVTAEIVDWDALDPRDPAVAGKAVLVFRNDYAEAWRTCCDRKAAAVLMCDGKRPDLTPDGIRWCNGMGRVGWYPVRCDPRCPIFCITPRKAAWIRGRLAAGEHLVGHGVAATSIREGVIRTVTGVIPGRSRKEVVLCAHIYEPFITDDAAGAAQAIEVATAIRDLSAKGVLPPLRHTVRVLIGMELYGFSQWFEDPARARRALHVFSFDSTCHVSLDGNGRRHTKFRRTLDGCPSFTDWLVLGSLSRARDLDIVTELGNLSDDTFMSAPLLDIPSNWIHNSDKDVHHNSSPLFADPDWTAARRASTALGTAASALATFGQTEAEAILPDLARVAQKAFVRLADDIAASAARDGDADFARSRIDFFRAAEKERLRRYGRFFGAKAGLDATGAALDAIAEQCTMHNAQCSMHNAQCTKRNGRDAPTARPSADGSPAVNLWLRPLLPGIIMSQARIPWTKRVTDKGFPHYEIIQAYCDGSGTLADAMRKCEFVTGHRFTLAEAEAAVAFFRLLARYGYFEV